MDGPTTEQGASLVEYALLIALIVLAALLAMRFFGASLYNSLSRSGSRIVSVVAVDLISSTASILRP